VLCIKPFRRPSFEFGCGQCLPCRINRRRTWAARVTLESLAYRESAFLTLTYSPEHTPQDNSLSKAHWREFTKGIGFRYFGCGEYGGRTGRPHYHLVLFGISALEAEVLALSRWRYGFVCSRPFCLAHASYVASYTVKKLGKEDDPRLSPGQIPEFALMSRRPAIGRPGLRPFLRWFRGPGASVLAADRDVPANIQLDRKLFPLGRTLRHFMRDELGLEHDDPVRTMRREASFRSVQSDSVLRLARERKRVAHYDVARHRAFLSSIRGSL